MKIEIECVNGKQHKVLDNLLNCLENCPADLRWKLTVTYENSTKEWYSNISIDMKEGKKVE